MKITITSDVFTKLDPQFAVAFLFVNQFDTLSKVEESGHLLQEQEKAVQLLFHKNTQKYHELISNWRVAMEELNGKAKHYSTSLERMMKKVLASKSLATKNSLQNLVYYIALKYFVPIGIDDPKKVDSFLTFSLAEKSVHGRLKKGELYYRDRKGILATKFDYWKSSRTEFTKNSTSALIHIEALPPLTEVKLYQISQELSQLLESFCGGKVRMAIIAKDRPVASL